VSQKVNKLKAFEFFLLLGKGKKTKNQKQDKKSKVEQQKPVTYNKSAFTF